MKRRRNTRRLWGQLLASLTMLAVSVTPLQAALTPGQKCTVAKLKAAAKKADSKAKCSVKTKLAAPPDATCLQKAEQAFDKAFAKAEASGACVKTGDAAAIETTVDTLVDALVQALQPPAGAAPPTLKCAAAKLKAASKKAVSKTTCQVKGLSIPSATVLGLCYSTAEEKFDTAFTKAEKPGACSTHGDTAAIEALVDTFVTAAALALVPPTPTPTFPPTPTPAPCTSGFHDNGDGTITDCATKLQWEKKDLSGNPIHDMNFPFAWAGACSVSSALCQTNSSDEMICNAETGGALGCAQCGSGQGVCILSTPGPMWDLAVVLNSMNFAGHGDWRIPTIGELQTIVDVSAPGCGVGSPCVPAAFNNNCTPGCDVTTCSCTVSEDYWSASTYAPIPDDAQSMHFGDGQVDTSYKAGDPGYLRAVRGGS